MATGRTAHNLHAASASHAARRALAVLPSIARRKRSRAGIVEPQATRPQDHVHAALLRARAHDVTAHDAIGDAPRAAAVGATASAATIATATAATRTLATGA